MEQEIINRIRENEHQNTCLTSEEIRLGTCVTRYCDDLLKDMYDNNFFEVKDGVTEDDFKRMLNFKASRGEKHFKIMCGTKNEFLSGKGMEEGILLTMLKRDPVYKDAKTQTASDGSALFTDKQGNVLTFRCLKNDDIKKDLVSLEVKHYSDVYGMDFTLRKCDRLYDVAKDRGNGLYYFAAYLGGTIVASCSAFYCEGVLGFDDLITDRDFRHRGIATALMAYVHGRFACPMFLHADDDDTPKEMYKAMGFETVKSDYEYFACDGSSQ